MKKEAAFMQPLFRLSKYMNLMMITNQCFMVKHVKRNLQFIIDGL
jgi:hypothetical protein